MSDTRLPRTPLPDIPVEIPAPPALPDPPDQSLLLAVLPVAGVGILALFYVIRAVGGSFGLETAIPLIALAALSIVVTVYAGRSRRRAYRKRLEQIRVGYLRALNYKRARLHAAHDAYRALLDIAYPAPEIILHHATTHPASAAMRRPGEPDFAAFRLGLAALPSPVRVSAPDPDRDHPLLPHALQLAEDYRTLRDAPVAVKLTEGAVGIAGARESALALIRAALVQLALHHAPGDLRLHVLAPAEHADDWRWLEWLPHTSSAQRSGAADLLAFGADNTRALLSTLGQALGERRESASRTPLLLVIVDGLPVSDSLRSILADGPALGAAALILTHTPEALSGDCSALVTVNADRRFRCAHLSAGREVTGVADTMTAIDAERAARSLASAVTDAPEAGRLPRTVDFLQLYGAVNPGDLISQISFRWRAPVRGGLLPRPVPIGLESASTPVELALAEGQHGPHGMIAGTTGAGKSELLQTLICTLAIEHDPRLVNFLLIDFKGGSTFAHFTRLPHTVGLVTNLDGALIERVLAALKGEVTARQTALRSLNLRDITQYHRQHTTTPAQIASPSYQPLPHLFVIVDEFAQLAREFPDFLNELVRVAQLGRSLGLHLILGTQSPTEVVTDEMAANLQFRISFRVQSIEASRAVLRRPDAAYLPADWPGRAYLQVGERGLFRQFQTAYAGRDIVPEFAAEQEELTLELITESGAVIDLLDDTQPLDAVNGSPDTVARAVVEAVLDYSQMNGVPFMPPLLLPPLGDRVPLRTAYTVAGVSGWNGVKWPEHEPASGTAIPSVFPSVILGLTDDLTQRRQGALWIDLSAGGLLVTGAPGSGKTTALWTLALSLALLHPPDSQHIYALSMTAGLDGLGVLPHVQTVSGVEAERVRRVFRRLTQALDERRAGQAPAPHMTLLIDGFEPFRDAYYDAHVADLERLAAEGRAHGITVAVTAISITALPERLRALIPQRVALRPAHPSEWGLMAGPLVPRAELSLPPGRGVVAGAPPLVTQLCIPSEFPVENPAAVLHEVGAEMRAAYQGASGRDHGPLPVRRLPTRVPFESLPHPASGRLITALGVQDDDAQSPLLFDWMNDGPHVVIAGGARTGKTNLLHAAALGAALDVPPNDLRLLLVDFSGRSLRALAGLPHAVHVTDPAMLDAALHDLPDVPMAILIDDYDLAADVLNAEGGGMALRALRDLARMRSDVYVWAAGYLDRAGDPLIRHLLMKRAGFALGRDGLNALGLRGVPDGAELAAPGRAVFAQHTNTRIVQTAWVEDAAQWVEAVKTRWGERETPAPRDNGTPRPAPAPFDIDTAGLIQDLLAGEQPDTAPQDAKPTKRRTARKRR